MSNYIIYHAASQFCIVGQIVHIQDEKITTLYALDDGTGVIEIKQWKDDAEGEQARRERSECVVGRYVRVVRFAFIIFAFTLSAVDRT